MLHLLQRLRPKTEDVFAAGPSPGDQPRPFQDLDVLRDRIEGNGKRLRERSHPRVASGQTAQNPATRGVGERRQGVVKQLVRIRLGHYSPIWVNNLRSRVPCQAGKENRPTREGV